MREPQSNDCSQGDLPCEAEFRPSDLAAIWLELLAASQTDSKARQFVDYFSADAHRLFGQPSKDASAVGS